MRAGRKPERFVTVDGVTIPVPPPGSIGLARIGGPVGEFIAFGQVVLGDASRWTHAFIVLDDQHVLEAMPMGARIGDLARYVAGFKARPCLIGTMVGLTASTQQKIVDEALRMCGCGYSFATYLSLLAARGRVKSRRFEEYITSSHRMICSALADQAYLSAGVHLFDDGRPVHSVTPGDLAGRMTEYGDFKVTRYGRGDT